MDAHVVRETARMVMLQYGLERLPDADGAFNLTVRDVVLWRLVRDHLARLSFTEFLTVLRDDERCFSPMAFLESRMIDRVVSRGGIRFDSKNTHPRRYLAKRCDYLALLEAWASKPRLPIPAFSETELTLTPAPQEVELLNEGFGGEAALQITEVSHPAWLQVERRGHRFTIRACPKTPGVYAGSLVVVTSGGHAELPISVERLDFAEPPGDEVRLDGALHLESGWDPEATQDRYVAFLDAIGFDVLPGNLAVRSRPRQEYPPSMRARLADAYLKQGELPFPHPLPARPKFFDSDGTPWPDSLTYGEGFLRGLRELLEDYEARPGQDLVLRPVPGGFAFSLEDPDPLDEVRGFRYWIVGSAARLDSSAGLLERLRGWLREGELNFIVSHWADNEFTRVVSDLHATGLATVKQLNSSVDALLYAEGEDLAVVNLETHRWVKGAPDPRFLWRSGTLLDGVDPREQASSSSDGLTLPLTPRQRTLAAGLRPVPAPEGSVASLLREHGLVRCVGALPRGLQAIQQGNCWFTKQETYKNLLELRIAFGAETGKRQGRVGMVRAEGLLQAYRVTREQLALWGDGVRVTQGGWIVPDPSKLDLTTLAGVVVDLLDEPVHHSQLRQIAEALLGAQIDGYRFLQASLHGCGWGGDGYRRRHIPGEPDGTNLKDVVRSLLDRRFLRRSDLIRAARRYVRTAPERIGEAYDDLAQEYWDRPR